MKTRIYFLDNLRTFLILLVVILHAGIVYEPILENTWIVSDPEKSSSIGLIRMYLDLFVMFIIFYISGYFIPFSVSRKTTREFLTSKFKRLMIPWMVAVFTLIPAYKVIFLYSRGLPQEEWFSYFHLFQRTGTDLSNFANNPVQNWLWFLPVLFLFQATYLGLNKSNLLSAKISLKTGVILTFVVGLVYSMLISILELRGWFNSPLLHFQRERLLIYFMAFLLGSLSYKLNVFESKQKKWKNYILSNVVLTISLGIFTAVALNFFFNIINPARDYFFVSETIDRILYYISALLSMLSFLYIFIHVFRFNFNKSYRLMSELNKNSYAVYIIHVVVMGVIALFMLKLQLPAFIKFLILAILTFVVSNVLVSVYRKYFQKVFRTKAVTMAIPIAAIALSILIYVNQYQSTKKKDQLTDTQEISSQSNNTIHEALFYGDLDAVNQYIKAGSELNEKDEFGSTPLIIATIFDHPEVAIALIEAGADLSIPNNEGSTPLHISAFFCRTEIVEALLENGADKSLKNNAGSTALETVAVPFEYVKDIYDATGTSLEPFGFKLDYEHIRKTRPIIAEMLK